MTPSPHPDEASNTEYTGIALDSPADRTADARPAAADCPRTSADPTFSRPVGSCHRELGLTLYRLRLERGLSLRALARCLGYSSHSAFADFEKARRMPGEPLLIAYERLFELPHGPLVALRSQAMAERAAWLTAVRQSTVLDPEQPPRQPPLAPPGDPSAAEVTRVRQHARADAPSSAGSARPLAGPRRRPKAAGGFAALGAAVAHLLGRHRATAKK